MNDATLTKDWLNTAQDLKSALTMDEVPLTQTVTTNSTFGQFKTVPYTTYYSYYQPPVALTLSEIERLRKAAKADDKLKVILQKFTGQIRIVVDFE